MECLLDDVLTGRQEMMGAIDAVCDSAQRIIGRLAARSDGGEALVPGEATSGRGDRQPTAAMRKYAASIAKRKGIKPPRGYTKSAALGGAPAGLLTGMPTTGDNRIEDPGWDSGWLRYDDGHRCQAGRDAPDRKEFNTLPPDGQ